MGKDRKEKFYIISFIIGSLALLGSVLLINYIVDPFFQFRVKNNEYIINPRFCNLGLIKNYDFNTAIIGSSMVQNYDLSILRKNPEIKPLKLTFGGLNLKEINSLYSTIDRNKVNTFIINADPPTFNANLSEVKSHFPAYLQGNNILDRLQYLLGYEATIRYTPVDVALHFYLKNKTEEEIPQSLKSKMSIDDSGSYRNLDIYNNASLLQAEYLQGKAVSQMNLKDMDQRMKDNTDYFFDFLNIDPQKGDYIFVLPPYSALYWYHAEINGYYSNIKTFVRQFIVESEKYKNVKILCFYDLEQITDLNNYTDLTHFSPAVSDQIVENLFTDNYVLGSGNIEEVFDNLDRLVHEFKEENKNWLPK